MYVLRLLNKEDYCSEDWDNQIRTVALNDIYDDFLSYLERLCLTYSLVVVEYPADLAEPLSWSIGKLPYLCLDALQLNKLDTSYTTLGIHELILV